MFFFLLTRQQLLAWLGVLLVAWVMCDVADVAVGAASSTSTSTIGVLLHSTTAY